MTTYTIPVYKIQLVREGGITAPANRVGSPEDVYKILKSYLEGADRENFVVILVGTKNQLLGVNTVSVGTLDTALVHPREVFKPAILSNAAAIILGHNHPSGDTTPSDIDEKLTKRLVEAGEILGIAVLDHLIIGNGYASLKERGIIK